MGSKGKTVYSLIKAGKIKRDKIFLAKVGQILEKTCIKYMREHVL